MQGDPRGPVAGTRPRWPFGRVAVAGESMLPGLSPGDWLLVRWYRGTVRRARPGDVVVVARPDRPGLLVVKRVVAARPDGSVWVAGDNPLASDDSRTFGPVPAGAVAGRVVLRYHRAARNAR